MLAFVDANLRFLSISISCYSSSHDSTLFSASKLGKNIAEGKLDSKWLIVGDDAFVCRGNIITPYVKHTLTPPQRNYNYFLSLNRQACFASQPPHAHSHRCHRSSKEHLVYGNGNGVFSGDLWISMNDASNAWLKSPRACTTCVLIAKRHQTWTTSFAMMTSSGNARASVEASKQLFYFLSSKSRNFSRNT
jgi:hypothetical protein